MYSFFHSLIFLFLFFLLKFYFMLVATEGNIHTSSKRWHCIFACWNIVCTVFASGKHHHLNIWVGINSKYLLHKQCSLLTIPLEAWLEPATFMQVTINIPIILSSEATFYMPLWSWAKSEGLRPVCPKKNTSVIDIGWMLIKFQPLGGSVV